MAVDGLHSAATTEMKIPSHIENTAIGLFVTIALTFILTNLVNFRKKANSERNLDDRAVGQVQQAQQALDVERKYTQELMKLLAAEQARSSGFVHNLMLKHSTDLAQMRSQHEDAIERINQRLNACEERHRSAIIVPMQHNSDPIEQSARSVS